MSRSHSLQGSCSCGRYNYVVVIPYDERDQAQVHFRTDNENRRSQAALLTAFLRVPLAWYSSNTVAFFPDETQQSISRTFSPVTRPHTQRKFCGYCGTHLSYWTEEPREEQDFMNITLGSLKNKDLDRLQDLDLLPDDAVTEPGQSRALAPGTQIESSAATTDQSGGTVRTVRSGTEGPVTWFEEMLDGSQLGRTRKTRRGVGTSADGTTSVSWEISEYFGIGDVIMTSAGSSSGAKRKHDDVGDEAT